MFATEPEKYMKKLLEDDITLENAPQTEGSKAAFPQEKEERREHH